MMVLKNRNNPHIYCLVEEEEGFVWSDEKTKQWEWLHGREKDFDCYSQGYYFGTPEQELEGPFDSYSECQLMMKKYSATVIGDNTELVFSMSDIMQMMENIGYNMECGACAEVLFCGSSDHKHTCKK